MSKPTNSSRSGLSGARAVRLLFISFCAASVYEARASWVAMWLTAIASLVAIASTLPPVTDVSLRVVRLLSSAIAASSGALLTVMLGLMVGDPGFTDPNGETGFLAIATLIGAIGGGVSEVRLHRESVASAERARVEAERRHADLVRTVRAHSGRGAALVLGLLIGMAIRRRGRPPRRRLA